MVENTSGIALTALRVSNFRALARVELLLGRLTLLIGENNAGKTSVLDALNFALGNARRPLTVDDILIEPKESAVPKDRTVAIDILIKPVEKDWKPIAKFPVGSPWTELWGAAIQQDDDDGSEFVAFRTSLRWDAVKTEYLVERKFLREWLDRDADWGKASLGGTVSRAHLEPLSAYYMDAGRDIEDELRNRSSFWGRLTSTGDYAETDVTKWEKALNDLNGEMVDGSPVLKHIKTHLDDLAKTISGAKNGIEITPIPRSLKDLSRGMDIQFATKDASPFSLARHGMGTRSLAAVMVFRAYSAWREKNLGKGFGHSTVSLEEPEAHLHPQAQRALHEQLVQIPGQLLLSTHSPYIASQSDIRNFRHLRKEKNQCLINKIDISSLSDEDVRRINRMVMSTRGELVFASGIVLFEGDTEEQALPLWARHYWDADPSAFGLSLIGVGGAGNYLPFIRLCEAFGIPWFIFSDSDKAGVDGVTGALKPLGRGLPDNNVVMIDPLGSVFENHVIEHFKPSDLIPLIVSYDQPNELEAEARKKKWAASTDQKAELLKFMLRAKTQCGYHLTRGLIANGKQPPPAVLTLFEKIAAALKIKGA